MRLVPLIKDRVTYYKDETQTEEVELPLVTFEVRIPVDELIRCGGFLTDGVTSIDTDLDVRPTVNVVDYNDVVIRFAVVGF